MIKLEPEQAEVRRRDKSNAYVTLSGDDRDRTGNLLVANGALSPLSYGPILRKAVETFGPEQGGISETRAQQTGRWCIEGSILEVR